MSSSPSKVAQRILTNNGEASVKTAETKYLLSPTSTQMGEMLTKMKSGSAEFQQSSPKKDGKLPTPNGKLTLNYSPNGSQYAYEKAKMKALFSKKNLSATENCDASLSTRCRKRKTIEESDAESRPKRRRVTKTDTKPVYHVEGASMSHILDAREIISAKRAGRVGNENQIIVNENESGDSMIEGTHTAREKLMSNSAYSENQLDDVNKTIESGSTDKSSIKVLDQNLNHISECIKRDNCADMYSRNVKAVCDSSSVKGKMSAFEISLLKGKQNLERRKSIESAALRSSPRMNGNEQRPNYREKKKVKARQSLESGFKKTLRKRSMQVTDKHKRSTTVDSLGDFCPSLIENEIVRPVPKRKKSRIKDEKINLRRNNSNSITDVERYRPEQYRLNGSPKLKNLPSRLSLDTLSGTTDTCQGSAFTSLNKIVNTRQISGAPPTLYSPTTIVEPSSCIKQSQRPNTLTVYKSESPRNSDSKVERCYAKATETARNRKPELKGEHCHSNNNDSDRSKKDRTNKTRSRKSLEETVNMLRKNNVSAKLKDYDHRMSLSPGHMSRRSSRSSTPNISPMKTEILTPSSSPCSSTCRSLCSSPTGGPPKSKKLRKKNYLFGRLDEVLARWHDGLYYLGKILKINEKQEKCLLRYEDDSEYWSFFKDIHRVLKEEEMVCCVCYSDVSEPPNEIVLCEYCLQGYHQQCHSPAVGSGKIIDPDEPWYCRKCVFFVRASGVGKGEDEIKWDDELLKMKVTLPYQLDTLTWDAQHKNNTQQSYCYCGGPGIWFQKMLQCCRCKQWFHEACIQCMKFPLLYADSFYIFVCALCNTGNEYIKRLDVDWSDLVHIGLFNLAMTYKKKLFDLHEELMPWLDTNWDQLQVTKYNDLTSNERCDEIMKALDVNKTRFVSGSELRKRYTLWGLRVRVPPPRIHITLPFSGEVTDQQMNKLKIKGRRSKVFTPVECKSPVNQVLHGPLNPSASVKKRLDGNVLYQAERKLSPSKQLTTSSKAARKNKSLPLLDRLIPVDEFYPIHFHPFKTEAEQAADNEEIQSRSQIWNKFLSLYDGRDEKESSVCDENTRDEPPILEKVEPIVPMNSSNKTPPMPEIEEKKNRKKSVPNYVKHSDKRQNDRACRRKSSQRATLPIDCDGEDKDDGFTIKHIKSVGGGKYYCQYDKTGYGKGFLVVGKRSGLENEAEYLVQWDG